VDSLRSQFFKKFVIRLPSSITNDGYVCSEREHEHNQREGNGESDDASTATGLFQ